MKKKTEEKKKKKKTLIQQMWNIIPIWARGRLFATKTKNIRKPRIPGMHGALFIRTSKDERIRGMNGWALSLL